MGTEQEGARRAPRLFATKTRIPLPPPNFVSRGRLLDALRAGLERKLTVVIAPAGFGKTTLVAELARELGPAAAWLALDPSDYDLSVFAHYLVEAIAQARPGFGRETRAWLAATPAPAAQIDDFAAILLNEIEAAAGERLVLFLDDYHEVNDSESITRLLDTLLRHLPPSIHLVISGRTPPALTITRLLVLQQVGGLGTDDLRFRSDEAATWLASRSGRPAPADVQRLIAGTDGWAAGMILQAAADDAPPRPGATSSQLYAYLSTEVLERQPTEIQHFLLRASVLNHLTVALCNTVLEMSNADVLLGQIQEQQLFLIATGGPGAPSYRLHQLFREFLSTRLRSVDPAEFARLHQRAAAYYTEHGDYGQAMEHLFASGDWDAAVALAAQVGPGEVEGGRSERVERWLDRFPLAERVHWPILLLLQARLLMTQAQYGAAADLVARGEHLLLEAGDLPGYAEALVLRARLAAVPHDGPQMVGFAQQALAIAGAAPTTRAQAQHIAAIGYTITGESERADAAYSAALAAYLALGDLQSTAALTTDWGYSLVIREELPRAAAQLEKALDYARQMHNLRLEARALSNLAAVYQGRGDLRVAQEHLTAALDIARQLRWHRVEAEILIGRAENALILEGPQAALRFYEECAGVARQHEPSAYVRAVAGQACCLRRLGRYTEAARLARLGLDAAQVDQMVFESALCRLEMGAAILVRAPEEALPLLAEAEDTIASLGRKQDAARAAAALASAAAAGYDYATAEAALERALTRAEEVGGVVFIAPELATASGLPLLRYADQGTGRYAGLLAAVTAYLATENEESAHLQRRPGKGLQVVHDRPRVLEVYSFGPTAVFRDGAPLARADWQTATAKELFFFLVEHPEGLRKEVILAALWPDQEAKPAGDNFHTSLRRLRGALGMEVVKVDNNLYRLNPALALWHDGSEVLALVERARQAPDAALARRQLAAAAALLRGPFADEFYREWAVARRQFWESRTKEILSWLADDALRQGALDEAGAWAQRLLALDPLDEAVHTLLMRIYAADGREALLIQQYNELRRVLETELGVAPNPGTQALYRHLRQTGAPQR